MFAINGKILTRNVNGQIRVAIETIKELDKMIPKGYVEIVAPHSEFEIPGLQNIITRRIGKGNPHVWEQTYFAWYLKKNKCIGINFLNTHPIFKPDIAYIHDVIFDAYPSLFKSTYGKFQKQYTKMMVVSATKRARRIITVSQFSKDEIIKYHEVNKDKISVIYNAWQHMNRINEDTSIFDRTTKIKKNEYIMAASGITPQKNFKWILDNSRHNPDIKYVIVGSRENSTQDATENTNNVIYLGRVSDEQMKALMHYCKAFIHPAIYEGFGLTPMEAVASGCRNLILAKASCLPEIYGDCAHYIDPKDPDVDLDKMLIEPCEDVEAVLGKYGWKKAARQLLDIISSFENE